MTRFTRAARAVALMALALALRPSAAGAQSPADCNANLLDETISFVTDICAQGFLSYLVTATDRTRLPPGCATGDPICQIGCDVLDVTASFCCPDPTTGVPPMPPDGALCKTLVSMVDIPATDATVTFGLCSQDPTKACVPPSSCQVCRFPPSPATCPAGETCGPFTCAISANFVGTASAGVFGNGFLDDGFRSPFDIDKTIAIACTSTTTSTTTTTTSTTTSTTTTTTSTTTSTTTTTLPPLCLARTPGFWGNHPFLITGSDPRSLNLLPLDVCGITFDNTAAGNDTSTTEAICSVGTDGKILGSQETQLIRQCVAAALNIAATTELGGDCLGAFATLGTTFDACCDADSVCTGATVPGFSIGDCITAVDAFNSTESNTVTFPFNPGPAKSGTCRASKGNGVVTTP